MMAILQKRKDEQGQGVPEAAPTRRVGSEAPIGSVTAGPSAGKSAAEFTQTQQGSPGSTFKRQLAGADIKGITSLAERPLAREAGQELGRVAGEGIEYKTKRAQQLAEQPQFAFDVKEGDKTVDNTQKIIEQIMAGGKDYETAQNILNRSKIEVPAFSTRNIKEFTPLQALRGGTVEGLLQKEARGPYSTGMAGLDALLFRQKGGAAELAGRGRAMQAGGQVFADVLQGRQSGVVPEATKTLLEKLGINVPSGDLTKEAKEKAAALVESQKTRLKGGLETGVKGLEESYMTAPEGQQSKLQQEYQRLASERAKSMEALRPERQKFIEAELQNVRDQALKKMMGTLSSESVAAQQAAGANQTGDVTIQLNPLESFRQAALADPRYARALESVERMSPYLQQVGSVQAGAIPELGLQNVIGEEDVGKYNRLQQLLGGKEVTRQQAAAPAATYDQDAIRKQIQNLSNTYSILQRV